jgi:hypothetical protein
MQFLATITKPHMTAFHFYTEGDRLYCRVNRSKTLNEMEYYPKEKWLVLKDFMKQGAGIKMDGGKNVKIQGIKALGIRIDDYILNKIFWNNHFNIKDEYTYDNYLAYIEAIRNKRGFLVRVCEFEKKCGTAILVSTIKGAQINNFKQFNSVKKALEQKPRNSKPLIYHITDNYYFIALRTSKKFICYKCFTGRYYRSSYLYDMDRYGWQRLESKTDSPAV